MPAKMVNLFVTRDNNSVLSVSTFRNNPISQL